MGRVDELIHDGVGNKLMHRVVGRADKLMHCGGVGRVDELHSVKREGIRGCTLGESGDGLPHGVATW